MFSIKYEIRSTDVDMNKQIRLSAIFRLFQETATMHYESVGLGRTAILDKGLIWVLSRIHITIDALPHYGDTITITTIPGQSMHSLVPRYFIIYDSSNTPLIKASSIWALLHFNTREITDPVTKHVDIKGEPLPAGMELFPPAIKTYSVADNKASDHSNNPNPSKNSVSSLAHTTSTTHVTYSDVDLNGHMNNTRYIDLVCDLLNTPSLFTGMVKSCNICYYKEAVFQEELHIESYRTEHLLNVTGTDHNSQKIFSCELTY